MSTPVTAATSVTVTALADAFVRQAAPNRNYGTAPSLRTLAGKDRTDSYLRFDLTGVSGTITAAKLRLYVTDASTDPGTLYSVGGAWDERTLTWQNRPALGLEIARLGAASTKTWVEVDISAHITTASSYSFAVQGTSQDRAVFRSREAASNRPYLVLTTTTGAVQPTADFSATPTSGTAPLAVSFTDTSSGSPTSWAWDFDNDGSTDSSARHPSYTYGTSGTYAVKLTATNASGSDTEIKTGYVTVAAASSTPVPPTADFSATPTSGTAPLAVTFTDTSSGSPTNWAWDFDNNGTTDSTARHPSYTYGTSGTHTVKLTVTNAEGTDSETKVGYITVSQPSSGGGEPLTVVASDDTYVNSASPSSVYGSASELRVRHSSSTQLHTYLKFTVAGAGSPTSAVLRLWVTESGVDGGSVYLVPDTSWSEGSLSWSNKPAASGTALDTGGAVSTGAWVEWNVSTVVKGDNVYSFVLVNAANDVVRYTSSEGTISNRPQLVVYSGSSAPAANFSADPTTGVAPLVVAFTDRSAGVPASWAWDFDNDGTVDSTVQHPSHTYTTPGSYTVRMTATNDQGSTTATKSHLVKVPVSVGATVETDPVPHSGDAADDPAIWVHPTDPAKSLIIGTDKALGGGLATYDLSGRQVEYRADGAMNNVDVRAGFALGAGQVSLVAATRESDNTIGTYVVDPVTRLLSNVESQPLRLGITGYGGCLYRSAATAKLYFFANSDDGEVEQWELFDDGRGRVAAALVRSFDVGSQVEGCVADDARGYFYIAEEDVGIWRYSAEPNGGTTRVAIDTTGPGGHLTADVEGLTIAYGTGESGYLIASSQGDDSYSVYDRGGSNSYVGSFVIAALGTIDGTSDTDGIDVVTANLSSAFREGLFVAQDGSNSGGNQNFKLVPFGDILSGLGLR